MKIYLLAEGQQSRFKEFSEPKQLFNVSGESILGRITRQVEERWGIKPVLVARNVDILSAADKLGLEVYSYEKEYILEAVVSTQDTWDDFNLFLLADVIFSNKAMDLIKENVEEVKFFGRFEATNIARKPYGEIFAFTFNSSWKQKVKNMVEYILNLPSEKTHKGRKKMWELYRALSGTPMLAHIKTELFFDVFTTLNSEDFTDDIDTEEEKIINLPIIERLIFEREDRVNER